MIILFLFTMIMISCNEFVNNSQLIFLELMDKFRELVISFSATTLDEFLIEWRVSMAVPVDSDETANFAPPEALLQVL